MKTFVFENFFFSPNFGDGQHAGTFRLYAFFPEISDYVITSEICNIREADDDTVIVETKPALFAVKGKIKSLEHIKKYLQDKNFSTVDFFNQCVENKMPSIMGWRLF